MNQSTAKLLTEWLVMASFMLTMWGTWIVISLLPQNAEETFWGR